jgi:hypothetical protein
MPISLNFAYALDGDIQPTRTGKPSVVIFGTQRQVYNDVEDWLAENVSIITHGRHRQNTQVQPMRIGYSKEGSK